MIKMKKWMEQFRVEDWVVVWVSIPLLALAAVAPSALPKVPATLLGGAAWSNIACLFAIVLVVLYAGCLMLRRPLRGLLASLVVVFAVSLLAQIVAKIPSVSYYGFESVFFSVLFGLLIRNVWRVPAWLKPAIQGEFYIKIGVVCLGATILFSDVMKSGVFGLVQACLVVAVVWFFAFRISRRMKVDERSAMILSSGVSICGVSACITAARVAGGDDRKLSYIVSLVLIVVVPMIYLMPWLAHAILPHIFDDPHVVQEVAGAWIGGTIDTTSGVAASSMIVGEVANQHAVIIKAAQNVLIGVVAFFIALYLSTRRGDKAGQAPSLGIVWEKFPKFIIGFVPHRWYSVYCRETAFSRPMPGANLPSRGSPKCSRRYFSRWPSSAWGSIRASRISFPGRTAICCGRSSPPRLSISSLRSSSRSCCSAC